MDPRNAAKLKIIQEMQDFAMNDRGAGLKQKFAPAEKPVMQMETIEIHGNPGGQDAEVVQDKIKAPSKAAQAGKDAAASFEGVGHEMASGNPTDDEIEEALKGAY